MQEYKVISSDGTELAVFEYGNKDGLELILLHGFALDHHVWEYQFKDKNLSELCRIITVDLRGHGQSSIPEEDQAYSDNDRWADDLDCIIKQCHLDKPVIVAWSYGGRVINDYLLKYGQSQILAINYVAAASLNDLSVVGPDHTILATMCSENMTESISANHQFVEKVFARIINSDCYHKLLRAVDISSPLVKTKIRNRPLIYDEMLSNLTVPVMATHGEDDSFVFKYLSINLAKKVTNGQSSIYSKSGHAPFIDEPQRFNQELIKFISEINH